MLFFVLLAIGIVFLVLFLIKRLTEKRIKALFLKALTSVFFVSCASAAVYNAADSENLSFGLFLIVGLLFGLLGDIWLDLKWIYPADNDIYTFLGFGSFFAGHIVYLGALLINFADFTKPLYLIAPVIIAVLAALGIAATEKPMKLSYGKFKKISVCYAGILALMTFMSGSLALMYGFENMTLNFMFIGGVFFVVSDVILSGTYFGQGKDRPVDIVVNHVTYYIAQFVIASSIMLLK